MSTKQPTTENDTAPTDKELRERALHRTPLGTDGQGATHYHDPAIGLLWVVHQGDVVQRTTTPVRQWVDTVADAAGWGTLNLDERPTGAWLADAVGAD